MRLWYGPIFATAYGMILVTVFVLNAVFYGAVYYKIRKVAKSNVSSEGEQNNKYHKSARLMLMFVAVYMFQWWTLVTQALWSFAGAPSVDFIILSVVVINLGGVYNAFVYTVIRKKYITVGSDNETSVSNQN